jgi:hypothetical protein
MVHLEGYLYLSTFSFLMAIDGHIVRVAFIDVSNNQSTI